MTTILINYYSDLVDDKSFVAGIKSQQLSFKKFIDKSPSYKLIGVFASELKNADEAATKKREGNFYQIAWPKSFLKNQLMDCENASEIDRRFDKIIKLIQEIIISENISVVLLNGFTLFNSCIWQAAKRQKTPVVYVHAGHVNIEAFLNPHFGGAELPRLYVEIEKNMATEIHCNIFLNNFSKKTYEKDLAINLKDNSIIIPASITEDFLNLKIKPPKNTGGKKEKMNVGIVARWDPVKNHQAFLEIAKYAKQKNLPFEFSAVTKFPHGRNPESVMGIEDEYKKHIRILKPLPSGELIKFYRDMDIIVCPSLFETLNKTVLECLLCGTPALISPTTGAMEIFQKFKLGGWIDDFKYPEQTLEKIKNIINSHVPQSAVNYIKEKHSPDAVFSQYLRVIDSSVR